MITGTPPRFTQLSRWSPVIDPLMVRMAPRPTRLHTTHHLSPFTPILEECLIAKPQRDFPKSAEGVLHTSPRQGESPIVPTLEECVAYAIAPPTNRVHYPPSYPWCPILDRASIRHPLQ